MKELFRGYYSLDEDGYKSIWENAVFIFDTNVLLNLYKYQSETGRSLLDVVRKLSDRVWMPYHVGLEFQRNRADVITGQHHRFSEVRKIIDKFANEVNLAASKLTKDLDNLHLKKRHSLINPDEIVEDMKTNTAKGIKAAQDHHFEKLNELESKSINTSSEDAIRDQLEALFSNRIGSPPASQEELDQLYKEGEVRYRKSIPPGFKDSNKANNKTGEEDEFFTYAGLNYSSQYGDLIIWKQILSHAKNNNLKDLIFVTDDSKEDWWQIVKRKTVGPRPELIDEIHREAGVENFHIYNTESFLQYANEYLNINVAEGTIEEVRELQDSFRSYIAGTLDEDTLPPYAETTDRSVYRWLLSRYENAVSSRDDFVDYVAYRGDQKIGFEVKFSPNVRYGRRLLDEALRQAFLAYTVADFSEVTVLVVLQNIKSAEVLYEQISDHVRSNLTEGVSVIVGGLVHSGLDDESKEFQFIGKIGPTEIFPDFPFD